MDLFQFYHFKRQIQFRPKEDYFLVHCDFADGRPYFPAYFYKYFAPNGAETN